MNPFKQWKERKQARYLQQAGDWIEQGEAAYKSGLSPQQGPYTMGTRDFGWWLCGWTIAWQGDADDMQDM